MPRRMTVDVHSHREACDVAWKALHVHGHSSYFAAEPFGTDARPVHGLEQSLLEGCEFQLRIWAADGPEKRLLGDERGLLKIAADAHADHDRRTRIGACLLHALEHEVLDAFHALGRPEHPDDAHVLTPRSLGHKRYFEFVSRHEFGIDDGRGIVAGVFPRDGVYHGLPEISFFVTFANTFVDGVDNEAVLDPEVLANLHIKDSDTRVLAKGNVVFLRDAGILLQELDDLLSPRRGFRLDRAVECREHVVAQVVRRVNADQGYVVPDFVYMNFAHTALTASTDFINAAFSSALSVISTTCSTPFAPSFTGTPAKAPFIPYSPSR